MDINNLNRVNAYTYYLNNPVNYSDPNGNICGIDDAIIIGLFCLVSFVLIQVMTVALADLAVRTLPQIHVPVIIIEEAPVPEPDSSTEPEPTPAPRDFVPPSNNKRPLPCYFYLATITKPGINVDLTTGMTFMEAIKMMKKKCDVWTPRKENAELLAFLANNAQAYISGGKVRICNPIDGSTDEGCQSGVNAFHYHLYKKGEKEYIFFI